jgi:hypothetical protein
MRVRPSSIAVLILLVGVLARPAQAQRCPLPDGALGYPVSAVASDPGQLDAPFLEKMASAAAYRWRVPSRRRSTYIGWDRVRSRLRTPEPRWAEDWKPEAKHRARLTLVLHRGGGVTFAGPAAGSGDRMFDESLASIVDAPMPAAPDFPTLPAGIAGDSALVELVFGEETSGAAATIRFAAQQRPVRLVPGTLNVVAPRDVGTPNARNRRATVKYDVTAEGSVALGSIEIVESSDPEIRRAIEQALRGARFTPAQSNCRAVAQSVVQTFG